MSLGMKSPTEDWNSAVVKLGSKDGPSPVDAFRSTMKKKPTMAKRQCLISRSFMLFHSSGWYAAVKVGPNHFGRGLLTGAVGFQPRSPGWTPWEYLLMTFS